MTFMTLVYERTLYLLSYSWALQKDLDERLWCTPLADLSTIELRTLCSSLQDGWGRLEIEISA